MILSIHVTKGNMNILWTRICFDLLEITEKFLTRED